MIQGQVTPPDTAHRKIWVLTLVVFVLLGGWMARYGPEPTADDYAQYLMHAQSMLDGRGYADIDYLFSHYAWGTGPPLSAPGLPLTILPVLATVGYGDWLHSGTMLLAVLLLAVMAARYFGRWNSVHGAATAFLVVVGLLFARAGSTLNPDLPFAILCFVVVGLADEKEKWSWSSTVAMTLAGVLALLYRTAGMALVPAMVVFGVISYRAHGLKPFLQVLAWSVTFWLVFHTFGAGQFPPTPVDYVAGAESSDLSLVQRAVHNALIYRWPVFNLQLYPFPSSLLNAGYHVAMSLIMIWALLRWLAGSWYRFGAIFFLGYVGMLLVAPVQAGRYFWPIFPFVAYGMVRGLDDVLKFGPLARRSSALRVMGPLVVLTSMAFVATVRNPPEPSILQRDSVQSLFQHFREVKALRPETHAVFVKPRTLAWHAGVPTMALFLPPTDEVALSELRDKRITHLVVGDVGLGGPRADERWRELVRERGDLFTLEYQNEDFQVYEVGGT